jgi:hypothetical protein
VPVRRVRWSVRGCALAVLLVVAFVAYGGWGPFKGLTGCVPSDFPHYGSSVWGGSAGNDSDCRETRLALEGSSNIVDFYTSQLAEGSWRITAIDHQFPVMDVKHATGASISGVVWLVDQGPFRVICLQFNRPASAWSGGIRLEAQSLHTRATRGTACGGAVPQASQLPA